MQNIDIFCVDINITNKIKCQYKFKLYPYWDIGTLLSSRFIKIVRF